MIDAGWLEATALAQHMKVARVTYPLVNAGHVLGVALLVGGSAVMGFSLIARRALTEPIARRVAAAGLALAALTGALLFVTQAADYLSNGWFRVKIALVACGLVHVAIHRRLRRPRLAGALSLVIWPLALIAGRMIGYA